MDNRKDASLRVPGFDGIAIDHELPSRERFAHGIGEYYQTPAITARELTMLAVMNEVTDIPQWHELIFEPKWASDRRVALKRDNPLLCKTSWKWCVRELQDKASEYKQTHCVRILDAGSCACKSDTMLPQGFSSDLKQALQHVQTRMTDDEVEVVDPLLYPLVYGTTAVDDDGYHRLSTSPQEQQLRIDMRTIDPVHDIQDATRQQVDYLAYRWSLHCQLLPSEVEFVNETGNEVKLTSYINNLNPRHKRAYNSIEQLISASIQPWNTCLVKGKAEFERHAESMKTSWRRAEQQTQLGRVPLRIVTFGPQFTYGVSMKGLLQTKEWQAKQKAYRWAKEQTNQRRLITLLGRKMTAGDIARMYDWLDRLPEFDDEVYTGNTVIAKDANAEQDWDHPAPGLVSYTDWKIGHDVHRSVVRMIAQPPGMDSEFDEPTFDGRYDIKLEDTYRQQGLQVIVKVGGIELDNFESQEEWQHDGMLNEHIVATSMYVYDMHNVKAKLSFRQETPMDPRVYRYEDQGPVWCQLDDPNEIQFRNSGHGREIQALAKLYGFKDLTDLDACLRCTAEQFQTLGAMKLELGRLVAYPNTIQHSLSLRKIDMAEAASIRYVKIYLVDPSYRVCSTRNVPAQQQHWMNKEQTRDILMQKGLPFELAEIIVQMSRGTMSRADAQQHKHRRQQEEKRLRRHYREHVGHYGF